MTTSQEILANAAQTAGLRYVSKAEAAAGMPVPQNQKSWLQTLKEAIAEEEHLGDSTDIITTDIDSSAGVEVSEL